MKKRSIRLLLSALLVLVMAFQSFAAPLSYAGPTAASEPAKITGTWSTDASGSWRFNAPDGAAKDGWYYLNTTNNATDYNWFCFDANGVMRTGWVQDKNDPSVWYYTGESKDSSEGGLVKGWVTDPQDGKKYYLDPETGAMSYGWKQIGGAWYYFGESRYADRGWAQDANGYWKAAATGRHSYGSLYVNEWTPDGYYAGSDGAWVQNHSEDDNSDKPDPIPEYSITVENDGNGTASASAQKSAAGKEITLTAVPNEGYQFREWNVVSGGVTVTENKFTMPANNVTVQAVFEEIPAATYTITYDANGATSGTAPAAQTKIQDEDLTLAANTGNLAKSVYRFAGWNTASDGTGDHYDAGATYTENAELTLYAEWAEHKTIAEVLATVEGFPKDKIEGSTPTAPSDAWTNGTGSAFTYKNTALVLKSSSYMYAQLTIGVTFDATNNCYTATVSTLGTLKFNMTDGVLTSFEYTANTKHEYDGTYAPAAPTFKAVYDTTNGANTLTFYYDNKNHSGEGITVFEDGTTNYLFDNSKSTGAKWGYNGIRKSVKSVVIDSTVANYTGLTSTAYMFYDMEYAENISGAEYLDVSQVTNMAYMFNEYGYQSSTLNIVPDVSEWNTGKVTNMSYMFYRYGYKSTALNAVPDVSEWNTVNVTTVKYMFYCYGNNSTVLSTVPNVSRWNTGNLTNVASMFSNYGCVSNTLNFTFDLSDWSVASVGITSSAYDKMFESAATKASKWSVTIPGFTGTQANNETHWYVGDGTATEAYIEPASGKQFTVKTTIADVLDTVPSGFPTSDDTAWVNADGKKAYKYGDNIKVGNLTLGKDTTVTKSGDNYVCKSGDATVTFNVKDGAAESITVTGSSDSNGIYAAPTEYTVTFDLNGITGTAPTAQKVAKDGKVTKPTDPTDAIHTFAGWYKTKDATTGALSDPWDFDNGTVTADMTLYAKWTRTMKDLLGNDFPKSTNNSAPENAWTNANGYKAFIYGSDKYFKLDPGNANGLSCLTSNQFTRISDDKYVFKYVNGSTSYGVFTLNIEDSTLVSIEYDGAGTSYNALSGTYTAPTPAASKKLMRSASGGQTHDAPMAETEVSEPTAEVFEPEFEPEKFEEAKPEELIEPAEAVAEKAAP